MNAVKTQIVNEIYRPVRRNFPRRKVVIKGYNDLFEADLVQMNVHARENKQYNYILTIINAYSRYAWAIPLKSKSGVEVAAALKKIFQHEQTPRNLHTDLGKEFYNSNVSKVLKELGVNHYSTHSGQKATMVERFNRTLKTMMYKKFALTGSYKWINMLPGLIKQYNNSVHSSIGMKPRDVTSDTTINPHSKRKIKSSPPKFSVGDHVRISKLKNVFDKGYLANFSTEIFKVVEVKLTLPVTYTLRDESGQHIVGSFYEQELTSVKYPDSYLVEKILRKKGDKVLVKWLGINANTWEDIKNMSKF